MGVSALEKSVIDNWIASIGHTPIVAMTHLLPDGGAIWAKCEGRNPGGSAKDRAALYMIEDAIKSGKLREGGTIVEPTSGNTGVGLAAIGAALGLHVILTMPESMSVERRQLLAAYGAQLVLTPAEAGMQGAIDEANRLLAQREDAWMPDQFGNPANARAHYETTGPEIYAQTRGTVDVLVAGVGTGGTLTGVGRYLKGQKPQTEIVAVEPADAPVLSGGKAGPHPLMGIGAGFVPKVLDVALIDRIVPVTGEDATQACRLMAQKEGLLAGISGGAAMAAAMQLKAQPAYAEKNVVVVLPDSGERYLSTGLFGQV